MVWKLLLMTKNTSTTKLLKTICGFVNADSMLALYAFWFRYAVYFTWSPFTRSPQNMMKRFYSTWMRRKGIINHIYFTRKRCGFAHTQWWCWYSKALSLACWTLTILPVLKSSVIWRRYFSEWANASFVSCTPLPITGQTRLWMNISQEGRDVLDDLWVVILHLTAFQKLRNSFRREMKLINTIKLSTVNHGFVVAYQISFKVPRKYK